MKLKRESVHHEGHRHLAGGARGWSPSPHGSRQTRIEVEAAAAPDRDSRRREAPVVDVVACHISPEVISFSSVDGKTCLLAGAEQEGLAHKTQDPCVQLRVLPLYLTLPYLTLHDLQVHVPRARVRRC